MMDYDYLKYKKILIADDEADLLEMVTSILEQDGFRAIKNRRDRIRSSAAVQGVEAGACHSGRHAAGRERLFPV